MKKELIFIIDSSFPYYSGGRETWLSKLFEYLIKKDYTLVLVNKINYFQRKPFFNLNQRIKIITVPTLPKFLKGSWPFATLFIVINNYIFSILTSLKIKKEYKYSKIKPLIVTLNPGFCSYGALLLKKFGFKYLCCVRGRYAHEMVKNCFWFKKKWFKFFRRVEIKTLQNSEKIIANGFDTKENLKSYVAEKAYTKIEVLPNGVEFRKYNKSKVTNLLNVKEDIVLSVATLRDIKGIPEIIRCIPFVVGENEATKFVFAGKGKQKPYIEHARMLNVLKYTLFLGQRKDIPNLLKQSKISLCVSGGSGISHSAIEALAAGVPVVAWDSPVYRQIIENGKNGILVKENDSKELARKILMVLRDNKLQSKLRINGPKSVEKYDWKNVVKQFITQIDTI